MKPNDNRSKLLAMIHMQKKALRLDDEAYRAILSGETSHESCADCTMGELFTVFNALNNVLLSRGKTPYRFFRLRIKLHFATLSTPEQKRYSAFMRLPAYRNLFK